MGRDDSWPAAVSSGCINADKYIRNVKLLPSAQDLKFGANSPHIFQQDSAPCHTAGKCIRWFQSHGVKLLQWPGNSLDLKPIKNLWARLKRLVANLSRAPWSYLKSLKTIALPVPEL